MKIDIHCHTTNRKVKDVVPASASIHAISELAYKYDIDQIVLLATYFPHKKSGISNFRLYNWIREYGFFGRKRVFPEFSMFGSLDFEHYFYQGYNELEEMCENEMICGIKLYTCYQAIDIKSKEFKMVMELARRFKKPVMYHTGYSYASLRKYGVKEIAKSYHALDLKPVAMEYPDVVMIFSHMGKPKFDDMIDVAKCCPNVVTDMSGLIDSGFNRDQIDNSVFYIKRFLEECGPKKLLFGTDFPVQTHEDSINFIERAMELYCPEAREDVYYNNASKILDGSYLE